MRTRFGASEMLYGERVTSLWRVAHSQCLLMAWRSHTNFVVFVGLKILARSAVLCYTSPPWVLNSSYSSRPIFQGSPSVRFSCFSASERFYTACSFRKPVSSGSLEFLAIPPAGRGSRPPLNPLARELFGGVAQRQRQLQRLASILGSGCLPSIFCFQLGFLCLVRL